MIEVSELAGFLAAHTFMSIKSGDRHMVNYGYIDVQGKEHAQRIKQGLLTKNMKIGQNTLAKNPQNAVCAALVYNCMGGLMHLPRDMHHGHDILVVEFKSYKENTQAIFGLRYRVADDLLTIKELEIYFLSETVKRQDVLKAFWEGFSAHELGAEVYERMDKGVFNVHERRYNDFHVLFFFNIAYGSGGVLDRPIPLSLIAKKFDDVTWHYEEEELPEGYRENVLGVHIGVFAIWCILNGLAGEDYEHDVPKIRKMYEKRTSSPGKWCIRAMDGKLTNSCLNDLGNAFAYDYYDLQDGGYNGDYFDAVGDDGNEYIFSVPDTWETYDKVAPVIARRFEEWQSKAKE